MVPPVNRRLPPPTAVPTTKTAACATWVKQPGCMQQLYGVLSSCGIETERGKTLLRFHHEPSGFTVQQLLPGRGQGTTALLPAAFAARVAALWDFTSKNEMKKHAAHPQAQLLGAILHPRARRVHGGRERTAEQGSGPRSPACDRTAAGPALCTS